MGVTLPRAVNRTGMVLRSATAVSTGTARACGARAAAPSGGHLPRSSSKKPIRATSAPPRSHFRLIIGNFRSGLIWACPDAPYSAEWLVSHQFGAALAPYLAYKRY